MRSNRSVDTSCVLRLRIAVIRLRDVSAIFAATECVRSRSATAVAILSMSTDRMSISIASSGANASARASSRAVRVVTRLAFYIQKFSKPSSSTRVWTIDGATVVSQIWDNRCKLSPNSRASQPYA